MNGALVYLFTFTNTENISSYRNRNTVIIYKISVTTVNFELNKLLLILLIIKIFRKLYKYVFLFNQHSRLKISPEIEK